MPDEKLSFFVCRAMYLGLTPQTETCWSRDYESLLQHTVLIGDIFNDALISRSRSVRISTWLDQTELPVMIFIDADVVWQPGDIERLVRSAMETEGIVGGVYPKRCFYGGAATRANVNGWVMGEDRLLPVRHTGTGFMAIHRKGAQRIARDLPYVRGSFLPFCLPFLYENEANGELEYLSEDYALCERAQIVGVPVHVGLKPHLGHVGPYEFRMDTAYPIKGVGERWMAVQS
jgi:hypothetical protein